MEHRSQTQAVRHCAEVADYSTIPLLRTLDLAPTDGTQCQRAGERRLHYLFIRCPALVAFLISLCSGESVRSAVQHGLSWHGGEGPRLLPCVSFPKSARQPTRYPCRRLAVMHPWYLCRAIPRSIWRCMTVRAGLTVLGRPVCARNGPPPCPSVFISGPRLLTDCRRRMADAVFGWSCCGSHLQTS
jgi:hypothetical protein